MDYSLLVGLAMLFKMVIRSRGEYHQYTTVLALQICRKSQNRDILAAGHSFKDSTGGCVPSGKIQPLDSRLGSIVYTVLHLLMCCRGTTRRRKLSACSRWEFSSHSSRSLVHPERVELKWTLGVGGLSKPSRVVCEVELDLLGYTWQHVRTASPSTLCQMRIMIA